MTNSNVVSRVFRSIREIDPELIVILLIPFILLAANNEWLFPYGHPSDAWINKKYFFETGHDFPKMYHEFPAYKATRVSWIIKGFTAHSILPPLAAHYALHLSMFLATLAIFYILLKKLFNRHIAFIGTIAFATHSQFHAVISFEWDYQLHDGVLNTLIALIAMYIAATSEKWRLWLILAGAGWASALQATYTGTFIPAMIFWYLYLNAHNRRNPVITSAVFVAIGGFGATLLYCVASFLLGGPFFFFMSVLEPVLVFGFSGRFNFHPGYWFPLADLLVQTKGLIFPIIASVFAVLLAAILLRRYRSGRIVENIILSQWTVIICAVFSIAFHVGGHGQLSNDHMIGFSAPFVFIGLCGVYAFFLRYAGMTVPSKQLKSTLLKTSILLIFVVLLIIGRDATDLTNWVIRNSLNLLPIPLEYHHWVSVSNAALAVPFIALATIILISVAKTPLGRAATISICLSAYLSLSNIQTSSIGLSSYDATYDCGTRKYQYQATLDAFLHLQKYDPDFDLRIWYRNNEMLPNEKPGCSETPDAKINLTALYGAILGLKGKTSVRTPMHLESYLATYSFDRLESERYDDPFPGRIAGKLPENFRAAVLSATPEDHVTALRTFRANGFRPKVLSRASVMRGPVYFDITVVEVTRDDRLRAKSRL